MCWLNSCNPETRTLTEHILTRPGSRYVPSGVVMRDEQTGQMVIVEQGSVAAICKGTADVLMRVVGNSGLLPHQKGQ